MSDEVGKIVGQLELAEPYKTFAECQNVDELTEALRLEIFHGYWGTAEQPARLGPDGDWVPWIHSALSCASKLQG